MYSGSSPFCVFASNSAYFWLIDLLISILHFPSVMHNTRFLYLVHSEYVSNLDFCKRPRFFRRTDTFIIHPRIIRHQKLPEAWIDIQDFLLSFVCRCLVKGRSSTHTVVKHERLQKLISELKRAGGHNPLRKYLDLYLVVNNFKVIYSVRQIPCHFKVIRFSHLPARTGFPSST